MSDEIAIKVEGVNKTFKLPHEKHSSLKSTLINFKKRGYEKQQVLNDISFEIKKGEFFGIVGRNGSGKSTLLKLLAGIYTPDSGNIEINGKLTPFIELGVGFNPELTGRENVFLNGALLGFNRKEMNAMYEEIVEFAELERFMDQKLKNYSSGMQVRLAFSIAIRAQSDILVLDEVLAVGDEAFQHKCREFFRGAKSGKRTVVLVTHDMNSIEQFCDKAMMLTKDGVVIGRPSDISVKYQQENRNTSRSSQGYAKDKETELEVGGGQLRIARVSTYNTTSRAKLDDFDRSQTIGVDIKFMRNYPLVSVIITCYNYAEYVEEAVKSVRAQSYNNIELVVINDGSTDSSDELLVKLSKKYKFNYLAQENIGTVKTRNKALEVSKGEYLIQLDADDMLESTYVEKLVYCAVNNNADIVYANYKKFGKEEGTSNFPEYSIERLKNENYMHISSLVKKSSIGDLMKFDENLSGASHEDWDFFLGMCLGGAKAKLCSGTYLLYRIHNSSRSNRLETEDERLEYIRTYLYMVNKYSRLFPEEFEYLLSKEFGVWYEALNQNLSQHKTALKEIKEQNTHLIAEAQQREEHINSIMRSKAMRLSRALSKILNLYKKPRNKR